MPAKVQFFCVYTLYYYCFLKIFAIELSKKVIISVSLLKLLFRLVMKNQIKNIATCLFAACLSLSSSLIARPVTVFVKNTSSLSRQGEMIELNASNVKQKVG